MLAYAPRPERRRFSPASLSLVIGVHAVAIIAVMSAKMDLPDKWKADPTEIIFVPDPIEPQPNPDPPVKSVPRSSLLYTPQPVIDQLPLPGPTVIDPTIPLDAGPLIGPGQGQQPVTHPPIIRTGPRFATPESDLRPPYPESKRELGEETSLRLRLSIDARGRVVAVEPVGRADAAFLAAARRHILKSWRYRPAMEGDRAIASSTVITLTFQLD